MIMEENRNEGTNEGNELVDRAFATLLSHTQDMMFIKDANMHYVAASVPFVRMVGKEKVEDILYKSDLEIFEDENLAKRYIADDKKLICSGKNLIDYIEPITDDNGHARYGSTSKYILTNKEGKMIGLFGVTKDITRLYIAKQRYQQELKYLFELPEDTYAVSYIDVDSWRIISQQRQLIGENTFQACLTVEALCEAACASIVEQDSEAAEFYRNFTQSYLKQIYESGRRSLTFKYQRKLADGIVRWIRNEVHFLVDADSGQLCVMLTAKDIDAPKREAEKMALAARMDKMTMLLNRETAMSDIRKILAEESEEKHALFMLDVDNFKALNDQLGHQTGDEFLILLAKEMQKCFRKIDVVGRVGGDEFFVLMRNITERAHVENKACELLEIGKRVCEKYEQVSSSVSVGISIFPENGKTLEELYGAADAALYQAKRKGKNQFVFAEH